jgi:hypothetical protein
VKRYRQITVPLLGEPRGIELSEYFAALDFAEFATLPGLAFRYYPDSSVTTPYDRRSTPWGYQVYCSRGSEFMPAQRVQQFYGAWLWKLDLVPATEPTDYHEV